MSQNTQALEARVKALLEEEAYEEALDLLEEANDPALEHYKIDALIELEDYDGALDLLDPLTGDPASPGTDSRPWTQRGFVLYYLDELADAQESFSLAIKINGQDVRALMGRALVYRENEYQRAAQLDLERALSTLSGVTAETDDREQRLLKAEVYSLMADFALEDEDNDAARAAMDQMVILCPEEAGYHLERARFLSLQGDLEAALESCVAATAADELMIEAWLLRSYILGALARTDEALEVARQAVRIDEEEPYSHLQLASVLALKGDFEAVLAEAGAAQGYDPELSDSYQLQAAALDMLGRSEEITDEMRHQLQEPADLPGFLYGERFDPYGEVARTMTEMASLSPQELQDMANELFSSGMLPDALRPMMQQVIQDLPNLLKQMPPGMLDNLDPEVLQQLTGGGRPNLTVIPGGRDED
jgi:tetratricopeptide (TPR) repeat protein